MLFSMPLNDDIVDNEKPYRISWLISALDEFSELFLYPSIFFFIHSISA